MSRPPVQGELVVVALKAVSYKAVTNNNNKLNKLV
jgi:hypothetical protein